MKLNTPDQISVLKPEQESDLKRRESVILSKTEYYAVLRLIAEMLDQIAENEDMYMTIGAVKNRTAYVLTVRNAGQPTSIYGTSFSELAVKANGLL